MDEIKSGTGNKNPSNGTKLQDRTEFISHAYSYLFIGCLQLLADTTNQRNTNKRHGCHANAQNISFSSSIKFTHLLCIQYTQISVYFCIQLRSVHASMSARETESKRKAERERAPVKSFYHNIWLNNKRRIQAFVYSSLIYLFLLYILNFKIAEMHLADAVAVAQTACIFLFPKCSPKRGEEKNG